MASRSVNKVMLLGHLGKDAETQYTPGGTGVTKFTLATNRRVKDQQTGDWRDETDWHNIVGFRLENVAPYLTKGVQAFVEGRLQTRTYEKEGRKVYYTEVVADDVVLVGGRGSTGGGESSQQPVSMPRSAAKPPAPAPASQADDSFDGPITDDDVPF